MVVVLRAEKGAAGFPHTRLLSVSNLKNHGLLPHMSQVVGDEFVKFREFWGLGPF